MIRGDVSPPRVRGRSTEVDHLKLGRRQSHRDMTRPVDAHGWASQSPSQSATAS